jgi:arylsulfatase A-like enzyme
MIDIVPTILEAAGIKAPAMVNGIKQTPIEGVSMAYNFDKANAGKPSTRATQYFELMSNRGIYHDGAEAACIGEIVKKVLLLQANAAAQQRRPLGRGTHVKGTSARAQFEVFDVTGNAAPDSMPVGSINRARWSGEVASRKARWTPIPASSGRST